MISQADQWTQTPSATPLQPKTWNACFCITFNFWWSARLVNGLKPYPPPLCSQKNEMLLFWITLNFWWLARLSDGLKHHPPSLSSQKNEMLIFGLHSTSDIGQAGRWTQTPSATPLQAKKWNAHFCITINFWYRPDWSMDSNPIHHPSPTKKMKCLFLDYIQLLMIGQACQWTQTPFTTPLQSKNEILIFGLRSTSDNWPGWLMDLNPIHHPSHPKKKCSFLDYVQLLMIGWAARLTWTPSTTPLQPKTWNACFCITFNIWCWPDWSMDTNPICHPSSAKKWNAHFWIMLNFWCWPDWSMDSNPIHHPSPAKKNEMLVFRLGSLLMICLADWWTWTPSATPLLPKKWNAQFSFTFNFWWSARLTNGLKPHLPALSGQKHEMLIFVLHLISDVGQTCQWTQTLSTTPLQPIKWNASFLDYHSTSDDWPGWSMDSNPIHHPSPANKMKSSLLYYVELLMISRAGWWTWTLSANPLQPKKWNAHFWILFNFWWSARLVNGPEPHPPCLSSQKHEILIYGFRSTSDDQPGWSMDLNPICHPSPAKKVKC